jgi:SAM-dependent methyltransferase
MVGPLYEEVARRLELGPGTRLVDLGCGGGDFAVIAAARGAAVTGIDATPALVTIARRQAQGATIDEGDIEDLPYPKASFDVATAFNAVQFAPEPARALREATRVVRPGGRVVIATWGRLEDCEAAGYLGALRPLLPPPPPGAGAPFSLADEAGARALVAAAGLVPGPIIDVDCPWLYADLDIAMRGLLASGPVVLAMRTSGEDRVRGAVTAAIAPYRTAEGGYRLRNKFRYLVAERP